MHTPPAVVELLVTYGYLAAGIDDTFGRGTDAALRNEYDILILRIQCTFKTVGTVEWQVNSNLMY